MLKKCRKEGVEFIAVKRENMIKSDEEAGDVSERLIRKMHSIIMENLLESPGEYRRIQVLIEKAEHEPPPAFEVPELMKELVE